MRKRVQKPPLMSFYVRSVLDWAQTLMACPSVTPEAAGTLDLIQETLEPLGFTCTRHKLGVVDNLYARYGHTGPHLLLVGHVDVVPPGALERWTYDPFTPTVQAGRLYGRGAVDMKGGLAALLTTAEAWVRTQPAQGSLSFLITADEEGPGVGGTKDVLPLLLAQGEQWDGALVAEPASDQVLGDQIKIGRRGSLNGRLTIHGTQGHAAYPERADNPLPRLVRTCSALLAEVFDEGYAAFQPSRLEITSIDVGNATTNVIPGEATVLFNVRFNPVHMGASLSEKLRTLCALHGGEHTLDIAVSGEAFLTTPGPFVSLTQAAVKRVLGTAPRLSTSGGTSDARFLYMHCPVVELGPPATTAHQVDEHVAVADLEHLTAIYGEIFKAFYA